MHSFEKMLKDGVDLEYAKILMQWRVAEDFQDAHPYFTWGWDGFVPFIHYGV